MKYEILPWLILFLPLLAAGCITLFTLRYRTVSALLSIGAIVTGFVLSVIFINANGWQPAPGESIANWLTIGGLHVDFGLKLDALSLMMLLDRHRRRRRDSHLFLRLHARRPRAFRASSRS